jgi:hypothetical protein
MRMAYPVLYLPFHLIQSALGRKAEAKLRSRSSGERRQGRSRRICREEACLPGLVGSLLSRVGGRASPHRAKSVSPSAQKEVLVAAHAAGCVQTGAMPHAITSDTRFVHSTDEVPRRRDPRAGSVTASYKKNAKGEPHALAPGTRSHWPRLQGCQQIQSSSALRRDERCNRCSFVRLVFDMEKVSPAAAASTWPAGTSSWQPASLLRNVSQHEPQNGRTNPLR